MRADTRGRNLLKSAWKIDENEISFERSLASGAYGEVWLGSLHGKWSVVIKKMFATKKNVMDDDEVRFLMRTRHPNLVMFLGCGTLSDGKVFLVEELSEGGSLDRHLWGHTSSLPWPVLFFSHLNAWADREGPAPS